MQLCCHCCYSSYMLVSVHSAHSNNITSCPNLLRLSFFSSLVRHVSRCLLMCCWATSTPHTGHSTVIQNQSRNTTLVTHFENFSVLQMLVFLQQTETGGGDNNSRLNSIVITEPKDQLIRTQVQQLQQQSKQKDTWQIRRMKYENEWSEMSQHV